MPSLPARAMLAARESGSTWEDIGQVAGITRQSAHARWADMEKAWREHGRRMHDRHGPVDVLAVAARLDEWHTRARDGGDPVVTGPRGQRRPGRHPVPEPFAGLLLNYTQTRPNTTTATNRDSRWLLPGRRGGQPLDPTTIRLRLSKLGILAGPGRSAAIRRLVLQTPTPVVARMLGHGRDTATRLATVAGSPWSRYAPGDHEQ